MWNNEFPITTGSIQYATVASPCVSLPADPLIERRNAFQAIGPCFQAFCAFQKVTSFGGVLFYEPYQGRCLLRGLTMQQSCWYRCFERVDYVIKDLDFRRHNLAIMSFGLVCQQCKEPLQVYNPHSYWNLRIP
jgi:hypothetical protein